MIRKEPRPILESTDPWERTNPEDPQLKVLLHIEGLEVYDAEKGLFQLPGVRPRNIQWREAFEALGYKDHELSDKEADDLADQIEALLWERDILAALKGRIRRA